MRHIVLSCAILAGVVCGASAAELGLASFYGHQRAGELTAAHRSLPFGSEVRVVNLDNGRAAVVKIVDRGPFIRGRVIDVSTAAADTLGFRSAGLAHVKIDLIASAPAPGGLGRERRTVAQADAASPYALCRYGADHAGQGAAAALSRRPAQCEDLRSRRLLVALGSDEPAPLLAHGGAFLTEMEAAARIPVNAVAFVAERAAHAVRPAGGCRAGGDRSAECETLRARLLAFAEKSPNLAPLAAGDRTLSAATQAAARIPVTALAEVPERDACPGKGACRKAAEPSSPVRSLFDRLRRLFD